MKQQRMVCGIRCLFCLSEWYGEKHCNTECEESVDTWKNTVNSLSSEAEKVKMIHDLIVQKVDYNTDIYGNSFNEDTATHSRYTAYSAWIRPSAPDMRRRLR